VLALGALLGGDPVRVLPAVLQLRVAVCDRRVSDGGGELPDGQGLTLVHVRAQLEQLQDTFMS
jgi:hypothetical protein